MRKMIPMIFRAALDEGIETLQKRGMRTFILVNMQYSPRTDIIVALGPYADVMRVAAQQHDLPTVRPALHHPSFVRSRCLQSVRSRKRSNLLALRVHDCIARAVGSMSHKDGAHLPDGEHKASQ